MTWTLNTIALALVPLAGVVIVIVGIWLDDWGHRRTAGGSPAPDRKDKSHHHA